MVNKLVTTGAFEIYGAVHKNGNVAMEKRPGTRDELHGMLGFIDGIDVYNAQHVDDQPPAPNRPESSHPRNSHIASS